MLTSLLEGRTGMVLRVGALLIICAVAAVVRLATAQEPARSVASSSAVAIIGDRRITVAELDAVAHDRLAKIRNEEYTIRKQVLDDYVTRVLLEQEAASRGVTVQELTRIEIDAKVTPVTEDQARAVLESRGPRPPGQTDAQAIAQIEISLRQARLNGARRRFVDTLRDKTRVRILLDVPRIEIPAGKAPSRGPAAAPVTIVEFSDFQCPYCRAVSGTLKTLEQRYGNKVRIVYRDFPLPNHRDAPKAAEAAACAHEQGRFWQMHDKLFESQSGLQIADLKRYARDIGLDAARFDTCLDSGTREAVWRQNLAEGQRFGVSATPTFFINGRMITGARPVEAFGEIIDEELGRVAAVAAR